MKIESLVAANGPGPFFSGLIQLLTVLWLLLLAGYPLSLEAAPSSKYWGLWDKSNTRSKAIINHSSWQGILDSYLVVQPDGSRFRYQAVKGKDRKKLGEYIKTLTALDPRQYSMQEQKAYWINLYNALTVNLILDHYPVQSITKLGSWYRFGPWDEVITRVADQALTLNDIEHRILRPLWKDPRIHYGVNCASVGCPDLAEKAFTGENTEAQLEQLARRFIQQEKGVEWVDGRLVLSRIYEWYQQDFGNRKELLLHLQRYSAPTQAKRLGAFSGVIEYQYNWQLNEFKQ